LTEVKREREKEREEWRNRDGNNGKEEGGE